MIPIVPAIIPASKQEIQTLLAQLSFSPEIHLDVVDGQFVPFSSWPYQPQGNPIDIKNLTDHFTLEVDLMVQEPLSAADMWLAAGADMLVFHAETIAVDAFRRFTESTDISVGISMLNDSPLSDLEPYLVYADYVQLMGIAHIGAQGQPFDTRVLERICILKSRYPNLSITVDGSVNAETLLGLVEAGADRFICGSAIVKAASPEQAHQALSNLIN
jgi:ribulose-phosphate 3-epimerase